MSRPRVATAALALATVLAAGGCADVAALPDPVPPTTPTTATTVAPLPDLTGVSSPKIAGATTTTTPAIQPGSATISGTVQSATGGVGGATVELSRIVGDVAVTIRAQTGPDGTFSVSKLIGGAYRVRAWQSPALALTTPQLFFLGGTDTKQLSLQLATYTGTTVSASTAPSLVGQGGYVDVVVSVQAQTVGTDGVVRATPVSGQPVEIDGGGGWVPQGADPVTTNANGLAQLVLQCAEIGAGALTITVPGADPVTASDTTCVAAEPTTTTTTTPTTTPSPATSSTTAGGPG